MPEITVSSFFSFFLSTVSESADLYFSSEELHMRGARTSKKTSSIVTHKAQPFKISFNRSEAKDT